MNGIINHLFLELIIQRSWANNSVVRDGSPWDLKLAALTQDHTWIELLAPTNVHVAPRYIYIYIKPPSPLPIPPSILLKIQNCSWNPPAILSGVDFHLPSAVIYDLSAHFHCVDMSVRPHSLLSLYRIMYNIWPQLLLPGKCLTPPPCELHLYSQLITPWNLGWATTTSNRLSG